MLVPLLFTYLCPMAVPAVLQFKVIDYGVAAFDDTLAQVRTARAASLHFFVLFVQCGATHTAAESSAERRSQRPHGAQS
jgi:hypothetical protein